MSSSIDDLAVPAQTEPEAAESVNFLLCAVCTQTGIETAPGSHCFETDFPRSLRDARYTPNGQWVCCQPCLSELMFQNATEQQQKTLLRYQHALAELIEVTPDTQEHLKTWGCFSEVKIFSLSLAQIALGINERRWVGIAPNPKWVDNWTPERVLRFAAQMAARDLQTRSQLELRACVDLQELMNKCRPDTPHQFIAPHTINFLTKALGVIDGVIGRLKLALAWEVSL